jgi:hypothetical protein
MSNNQRNSMHEIVERIKDIISNEIDGKVYDKHVAKKLHFSPSTLRVYKIKNYIPYERIADFCLDYGISFDALVFEKKYNNFIASKNRDVTNR